MKRTLYLLLLMTLTGWAKALVAAVITGCSNSFLSAVGVAGAQMIGVQIENLSPKQLVVTTLMGGLIGMFAYLKQSPVPPDTGDTETVSREGAKEAKE